MLALCVLTLSVKTGMTIPILILVTPNREVDYDLSSKLL